MAERAPSLPSSTTAAPTDETSSAKPSPAEAALLWFDAWAAAPVWYRWGGKSLVDGYGLDCSGSVCLALERAGVLPAGYGRDHNAESLFETWAPVAEADVKPGDCVFYRRAGQRKVTHVMMVADERRVVGASGGGSRTTTIEIARQMDARVKYCLRKEYRVRDVVGYRRPPGIGA